MERRSSSGVLKGEMGSFPPVDELQTKEDANLLAMAIVDTIREPVLVLDAEFCIGFAGRAFHATFDTTPKGTAGRKLYDVICGAFPKIKP